MVKHFKLGLMSNDQELHFPTEAWIQILHRNNKAGYGTAVQLGSRKRL